MSTGPAQARWTPLPFSGLAERVRWMTAHRTRPSRRESPPPTPFSWPVRTIRVTGGEKKEAAPGRESGVIFSDAPPEGRRAESRLVGALFLWALFFVSYYFLLADPLLALSKRWLWLAKRLAGRLAERWASRLARRLASGGRVGRESGAGR